MCRRGTSNGMGCPECGGETRVIDSRLTAAGAIRRRRKCRAAACGHRFTTVETVAPDLRPGRHVQGWADTEESARKLMEDLAERAESLAGEMRRAARPEKAAASGMLAGLQL